jgi:hypothetical protein
VFLRAVFPDGAVGADAYPDCAGGGAWIPLAVFLMTVLKPPAINPVPLSC